MRARAKLLTFFGALVGAFTGTLIVAGIGTAVGVIAGIMVGAWFARQRKVKGDVAVPPGGVTM